MLAAEPSSQDPPRRQIRPPRQPGQGNAARAAAGQDRPRLAEGVELLGEYEGSGFKEPRYIVKRSDGQMIQLDPLMYFIVENIDGSRSLQEVAGRVTESYGKTVSADNVQALIDKGLVGDGIVAGADGSTPQAKKLDPLLQLKMRVTILPEGPVNAVAGLLRPLFWPPLILAVLVALALLDIWYFGTHGVGQSLRETIYQPLVMLLIYALLIISVGWHELGHATAARYGGARPGKIGFGIYIIWPAFFTDVTDVYTLGKTGRVRTDLGGVYFNAIFTLAVGGIYFATGFEPLLVLIMIQHLLIVYQFMPFLRMDGYYVVSDTTGVPDLFGRLKPTLKSMVPGKESPKEVRELKRWVRVVVGIWVLTVIPVLLFLFGMMIISAPRVLSTTWDSFFVQWQKLKESLGDGQFAGVAVGAIETALLVLPVVGMTVMLFNVLKQITSGFRKLWETRQAWALVAGVGGTAALAFAAFVLWPNGEYRPIQPQERWTFTEGVDVAKQIDTGRPSLTEEAAKELKGAPTVAQDVPGLEDAAIEPGTEPIDPATQPNPRPRPNRAPTGGVEPSPEPSPTPSPEV